jgi:hypothetical protein
MPQKPSFFVVGRQYENQRGAYTVLSIDERGMKVRYVDGNEQTFTSLAKQRRAVEAFRRDLERETRPAPPPPPPTDHLSDDEVSFRVEQVRPVVSTIIRTLSESHTDFVTHEEIVAALLARPAG